MSNTIYALATPPGKGSIAIVRISGSMAKDVLASLFHGEIADHKLCYGSLMDGGQLVDQCMAVYLKAPKTYTREDMAELHLHGGWAVTRKVLDLLGKRGLTPALPGEFTKRAFLNGRVDLSQAEAVMDMISAESEAYRTAAARQLSGGVKELVNGYCSRVLDLLAKLDVCVDFPEEDIEETSLLEAKEALASLIQDLSSSVSSRVAGRVLSEGYEIALIGRPNVGKSSLLNAILGADRVIVTDVPGTTRDTLKERYTFRGMLFTFMDTAGIRKAQDVVEKLGIEKTYDAMAKADLVLLVLDGSQPLTPEDRVLLEKAAAYPHRVVLNKADIGKQIEMEGISVSAKNGSHMSDLLEEIYGRATSAMGNLSLITNSRHIALVEQAIKAFQSAIAAIQRGADIACVEIDIREGWHRLCEITGEACDSQIIDRIFEKFCLGK